jgi:hypothetical protein
MNSLAKAAFVMVALGVVVLELTHSESSYRKNKNPETVSLQDKNAAVTIDPREARGRLISTKSAMEKNSLEREHLL